MLTSILGQNDTCSEKRLYPSVLAGGRSLLSPTTLFQGQSVGSGKEGIDLTSSRGWDWPGSLTWSVLATPIQRCAVAANGTLCSVSCTI